jgi:hypothetical protein
MCHAIRVVRSGDMGYLRASKYFSVPRGTLERDVKGTSRSAEELGYVNLGRSTVLPSELENKRTEYCIITDQRYYGLRRQDIKHMAFQLAIINAFKHQLAIINGFKHPFNQEKSVDGKTWI